MSTLYKKHLELLKSKLQAAKKQQDGSRLEHGKAHEEAHRQWSRRGFLKGLGIAGGMSMMLGKTPISATTPSPFLKALSEAETDRVLVLIRLKGGNDGLNTIIPTFDYGTYSGLRPTIAIPNDGILPLSSEFGMPNYMSSLQSLWQEGQMKVVHSVGYPNQNLSHFRSSDIWASASDANEILQDGWLGRYLSGEYPDYLTNPPTIPPAVQIGGSGNLVFKEGLNNLSVVVNNPEQLFEIAQNGALYDTQDVPDCLVGDQLSFLRTVANTTFFYAGVIKEAYDAGENSVEYSTQLGEQLSLVARLIKGDLGTKLFMVELGGFDTHAEQNNSHPNLMNSLAGGLNDFFADLEAAGLADKVLAMTFSEFGRRIEQNASNGTDHGAAAPLMLFGGGLNGNGFVGTAPDLQDLDEVGNLKFHTDFREIYATVMENWLCIDSETVNSVLGQNFNRIGDLGLDCTGITSIGSAQKLVIEHQVRYGGNRQIVIHYTLPHSAHVRLDIHNLVGQVVLTLVNDYQLTGRHQAVFNPTANHLPSGQYIYRIEAGGQAVSRSVMI
ncbi:MAG: DUF1501 domain-containing protein [Chitinophagales bacterium]